MPDTLKKAEELSEKNNDFDKKNDIESQAEAQSVIQRAASSDDVHDRELSAGVAKVEVWMVNITWLFQRLICASTLGCSSCLG